MYILNIYLITCESIYIETRIPRIVPSCRRFAILSHRSGNIIRPVSLADVPRQCKINTHTLLQAKDKLREWLTFCQPRDCEIAVCRVPMGWLLFFDIEVFRMITPSSILNDSGAGLYSFER